MSANYFSDDIPPSPKKQTKKASKQPTKNEETEDNTKSTVFFGIAIGTALIHIFTHPNMKQLLAKYFITSAASAVAGRVLKNSATATLPAANAYYETE